MPNTDPPVDDAQDLVRLRELAAEQAVIGVGFICAITKGQEGAELTEAAELAALGAVALSDDGHPVSNAAVFRRALQYQRLAKLPLTLHEEDMDLSAGGAMHEGAVSARLGVGGIPAVSESVAVARDVALAELRGRAVSTSATSRRSRPSRRCGSARHAGCTSPPRSAHTTCCWSTRTARASTRPPAR